MGPECEKLGPNLASDGSRGEKDCAWCKIMEQKICRKQYDVGHGVRLKATEKMSLAAG